MGIFRCRVLLSLLVLAGMTVWVTLLSSEQFRVIDDGGCQPHRVKVQQERAAAGSESEGAEPLLNNSVFLQALAAPKRPLLVRFDWYSRKNTPVHIGWVLQLFSLCKSSWFFPCRYAGRTAMAILEPYGFQEVHSDDWVSVSTPNV